MKFFRLFLFIPLFLLLVRCTNDGFAPGQPITFAFLSSYGSNQISVFEQNTATGVLTHVTGSPFTNSGGSNASGLAVHPSGKFLYTGNDAGNSISGYNINATTGELTPINGSPFSGTTCTGNLVPMIDPSGRFLYIQNFGTTTICGFTINQSTGVLTSVGAAVAAGTQPFGGVWHPNGRFYYSADFASNNLHLFSINQTTGVATGPTAYGIGDVAILINFDKTGRYIIAPLAVTSNYASFPVDSNTGAISAAVSSVASAGGGGSSTAHVVAHPNNRYIYGCAYNSPIIDILSFNSATGALATIGSVASAAGTRSITLDPNANFLYAMNETANNLTIYSVNQSTGGLTPTSFSPMTGVGTTPQQLIFHRMPQPRP